ncbi:MAG: protein kinase [Candidatus Aminicenantes bacterium]|nr:MAG: protein kinase [Candidatus Aminicenantes bacterium]
MSVKCQKCNADNPDTQSFCGDCGTQLGLPKEIPGVTKTMKTPFTQFESGTSLADRYEIIGEIGKGGMGEVYLAEDTNLKRQVAIKILPQPFALDEEMLARFEREARMLASLNHPNIATIHGLEKSEGQQFLVMELVEGDTLAERISNDPLPVEEALRICRQITEGLESAHEKGIIHRDLKPANIKITKDGKVKILDFGLAKVFEGAASGGTPGVDLSKSPTITVESSHSGVILGTAAYMSPEQARGKILDKKTDIWSFGCVLFEMLTGRQAFKGDTISDYIAAILKNEPDWKAIPEGTSVKIRDLLRRCLQKDPHNRLHDIADARIDIQYALAEPDEEVEPAARPSPKWRSLFLATAGLAIILTCVLLWNPWRTNKPLEQLTSRFAINLPPGETLELEIGSSVVLSPDGKQLIYVAQKEEMTQLYLRPIHEFEAQPISGTEGARGPFFSPDGNWVAFHADGKLKKVSLLGGTPQLICDAKSGLGGTWSEDGTIYFGDWKKASLIRVPSAGGDPELLATGLRIVDEEIFEHSYFWPQILPGGKDLLYTIWNKPQDMNVAVYSLERDEHKTLIEKGGHARYLPAGFLVYTWAGDLMAVPFDLEKLEVTGSPTLILEGIQRGEWGLANFALSETGSLVFIRGFAKPRDNGLVWVDLEGNVERLPYPLAFYQSPRLSPDGKQLVVTRLENLANLWIYGLERGTSRRLTDEKGAEYWAIWTLDGKRIVFNSTRMKRPAANLLWKPADGSRSAEFFAEGKNHQQPKSWSADGKVMAITEGLDPETGIDIFIMKIDGDRKPEPFLHSRFNETQPLFSPDGRWIAYVTDESGRDEVYVQPYPGPGDLIPISTDGGMEPVWSPDGKVLYYRDVSGNKMMAVSFITEPELRVGKPQLLFEGKYYGGAPWGRNYDISPDGTRFIMITDESQSEKPTQINVILNWSEELKRLDLSEK